MKKPLCQTTIQVPRKVNSKGILSLAGKKPIASQIDMAMLDGILTMVNDGCFKGFGEFNHARKVKHNKNEKIGYCGCFFVK